VVPPGGTVDELAFREAIAHFATGVTVVTTTYEGRPAGMTASAVCSLSLDPILLLVCIDNRLPTHEAIEASRRFAVNVLGEGDEALARRFARPAEDKFAGVALVEGSDPPVLAQAIARFCTTAARSARCATRTPTSSRRPRAGTPARSAASAPSTCPRGSAVGPAPSGAGQLPLRLQPVRDVVSAALDLIQLVGALGDRVVAGGSPPPRGLRLGRLLPRFLRLGRGSLCHALL
jgi:hypothetical protein